MRRGEIIRLVLLVLFAGIFVFTLISALGCASPDLYWPTMGDVKQFAAAEREQLDAHDRNMSEQHKTMAPDEASAIDAQREAFEAELRRVAERTDALQSEHSKLVGKLIEQGAALAAAKLGIDGLVPRVDEVEDRTEGVAQRVGDVAGAVSLVRRDVDATAAAKQALDAKVDAASAALATLRDDVRGKLSELDGRVLERLQAAQADSKEFFRVLRDEAGLTEAEVERIVKAAELEGLDFSGIVSAILAAAAGGGITGGLASKFGKSRASTDVEKVKGDLAGLREDVALHKPPPI